MIESKFYVLDGGDSVRDYCDVIIQELKKHGHHVVYYETDLPTLMQLEEVDEDTFLDHYRSYLKTNN